MAKWDAAGENGLADAGNAVPDIRVHYVGVYPMDRFKAVDQDDFEKFVLQCLAAQADNSDLLSRLAVGSVSR